MFGFNSQQMMLGSMLFTLVVIVLVFAYHHPDLLREDLPKIKEEIEQGERAIKNATGVKTSLFRPPHGFRDPLVLEWAKGKGYVVIEWSVMAADWTRPGTEVIVQRIVPKVSNGAIILLHDGAGTEHGGNRRQTVEAVGKIIPALQAAGYHFVTVPELLGIEYRQASLLSVK